MATLLQYRAAALIARLQAAGAGGHHLACDSMRVSAIICPGDGPKAHHVLRLKPDHPMGSGQAVQLDSDFGAVHWRSEERRVGIGWMSRWMHESDGLHGCL